MHFLQITSMDNSFDAAVILKCSENEVACERYSLTIDTDVKVLRDVLNLIWFRYKSREDDNLQKHLNSSKRGQIIKLTVVRILFDKDHTESFPFWFFFNS